MSLKIKITSKLDQEGNLFYKKGKLKKFFSLLNSSSSAFSTKKDVDLYLVYKNREINKENSQNNFIRQRRISDFAVDLKLDNFQAEMLLSSQGSIKDKKFFETVNKIIKSE